jgi:predicted  nucleic acid-binding Zn-ribbon protein
MYHTEHQNLLRAHKRIEKLQNENTHSHKTITLLREEIIALERELAEAQAALISALGVGYDENGWQDLARTALALTKAIPDRE